MECAGGARSGALPLLEGVTSLPSNVHLLTMMQTKGGAVLLRLAHLFEAGEGGAMGEPACIDLQELLGNIAEVRDMSLTGVPLSKERATRRLWNQRQDTAAFQPAKCKQGLWVYSLKPMEIRTWEVYFQDDHPPTGRTSHGPLQA